MCTKTEEKILIASKPFIKKSAARALVGCAYDKFVPIWDKACEDYLKEHDVAMLPLGLPTEFFMNRIGITIDQLEKLAEYEKRFSE